MERDYWADVILGPLSPRPLSLVGHYGIHPLVKVLFEYLDEHRIPNPYSSYDTDMPVLPTVLFKDEEKEVYWENDEIIRLIMDLISANKR